MDCLQNPKKILREERALLAKTYHTEGTWKCITICCSVSRLGTYKKPVQSVLSIAMIICPDLCAEYTVNTRRDCISEFRHQFHFIIAHRWSREATQCSTKCVIEFGGDKEVSSSHIERKEMSGQKHLLGGQKMQVESRTVRQNLAEPLMREGLTAVSAVALLSKFRRLLWVAQSGLLIMLPVHRI